MTHPHMELRLRMRGWLQVYVTKLSILWQADQFLGNDSVNTFPRQRILRQQLDNFRCYATRCKYNNRGRGVFYVVHIHPLLGNGCVFYGSASRLYKSYKSESNQRSRVEAGSNTSTVALRVVGDDEKGIQCLGV
jgi:hypothetical protein